MIVGTKIGLRDYQQRLPTTQAKFAEIYFRSDQADSYSDLFTQLSARNIEAGLHFWGTLDNDILYNLAYPQEDIRQCTLALIKETIDLARQYNLKYVNVHPGNRMIVKLDLDKHLYKEIVKPVSISESTAVLLENTRTLHHYAAKRNVLYLTETVPLKDNPIWYNETTRHHPIDIGYVTIKEIILLASKGYYIANDFGHTACNCDSSDPGIIYEFLYKTSLQLAPQTKLIHANTTRPPFTGVDTHNGILDSDFAQSVLPDKQQLLELLKLYKNQVVFVINEPLENHEENFSILKSLVAGIE